MVLFNFFYFGYLLVGYIDIFEGVRDVFLISKTDQKGGSQVGVILRGRS
jgi:hypothetical protein